MTRLRMNETVDRPEQRTGTVARWRFQVNGVVQGVGFRPAMHALAGRLALSGWVRNSNGGVEMELQGSIASLERFAQSVRDAGPPLAQILTMETKPVPVLREQRPGLAIIASDDGRADHTRTLVPVDVATCADCLAELFDPSDRRYHYPFTNCTNCGPRFTIITGLPYDRPRTTMASFSLCARCVREYEDPSDRRFHAQPVACPNCGPHLALAASGADGAAGLQSWSGDGADDEAVIAAAANILQQGGIVAVKGLGGFHLACRADDPAAIARLRRLKGRPYKPLAIMAPDIASVRQFCHVKPAEAALLSAKEAPIVLLRKRKSAGESAIAEAVAPQNGAVGVLLPYTPLHHLLLQAVGGPLVMTSGNRRGEPLCYDNTEARSRLDGVCDRLLLHDRPIVRRCDDSILFVAELDGRPIPQQVRRSRGYAPLPVLLPEAITLEAPLLATGSDLKNVCAVAVERMAFLTQHIGNLESPAVRLEQAWAVADLEALFHIRPAVAVCDLHPDYASGRYARRRATEEDLRLIEVQHHHAHIAGCLAENDFTEPAIGLSFDGTGYGTDGCIWGGEVLLCDLAGFRRLSHLQYLPLPGGDAAIRRLDRLAFAYLRALLPDVDAMRLLPEMAVSEAAIIEQMVDSEVNTALTSSMGRLFDAVSALLGLCHEVTYEAQAAVALENAALQSDAKGCYDFLLSDREILLEPLLAQIVAARQDRTPLPDIARRFHRTIAEIAVRAAEFARDQYGISVVALSGGVWQNRLLLEMTVPLLRRADFRVLLHHNVPANDGGLAYGQAVVAAARLKGVATCV